MTSSETPPKRELPGENWPHTQLHQRVRDAIRTIPLYFRTQTTIEGLSATDIFTLSAALGATIENQVVSTLNQMRSVWDPDEQYGQYAFVRQSQTFPDVLLKSVSDDKDSNIIMGIELKGWYLLAKEGDPSFRFSVTPAACAVQDLIVVVPWALTNVISGSPTVFPPYIEAAKYAAQFRNYHWSNLRSTKLDAGIDSPSGVAPYPKKSDVIADTPRADGGNNFGRFARTGLMDDYLNRAKQELLAGIRAEHWLAFFKIFQDQRDPSTIAAEIERLRSRVAASGSGDSKSEAALIILDNLERLLGE